MLHLTWWILTLARHSRLYRALHPKSLGQWLFDNFGQYLLQHYFAALDEKRFLLSDIVQDFLVVTDMHIPTLARLLNVLRLLVLDLCELLQILFFLFILHSFATAHYFAEWIQITLTNCILVKPVVPKHLRDVTLIKVAIMSYYP